MEPLINAFPDMVCTLILVAVGFYVSNKLFPILERILEIQERRLENDRLDRYAGRGEDRDTV